MKPELNDISIINIYTDASMLLYDKSGCAGFEAYRENICIGRDYMVLKDSTNNQSEAYAIYMGSKYIEYLLDNNLLDNIKYINIFSDSKINVYGLRDWIKKWIMNIQNVEIHPMEIETASMMISSSSKPVANQYILVNIANTLISVIPRLNELGIMFNIYHVNGHGIKTTEAINEYGRVLSNTNNILEHFYIPNNESIISVIDRNNSIDNYTRESLYGAFTLEDKVKEIDKNQPPENLKNLYNNRDKLNLIKGGKERL